MRRPLIAFAIVLAGCQDPTVCPADACDPPRWEIDGVGMELDNLTRVAVVGRAMPLLDGDMTAAAVTVEFEAHDPDVDEWDLVVASVALVPSVEQEFVVVSDDVRYWPGGDGYDDVCAVFYGPDAEFGDALGCMGDQADLAPADRSWL